MTAIPAVAMMLFSSLYSIIDGIFVSNFAGTTPFAALNLSFPPLMVIASIGVMVGTGGSALVSKTMGAGDQKKATEIFSMLVRFEIILGIILSLLFFIFCKPILIAIGADDTLIHDCLIYARICSVGLPFFIVQLSFNSFYMTSERPQLGTKMTIVSGVTNIILDALLIAVFKMGLAGAAIATVMAQIVGSVFPLYYYSSKRNNTRLKLVPSKPHKGSIMKACTNGLSEYVGNIALNVVGMCYNIQLMKLIGENGVAAYGILMYIGFVFAAFSLGYNISITPIVGYNYGYDNKSELKSLLRKSLVIQIVFGMVLTIIAEAASGVLAGTFVGYDQELKELTQHAIRLYMLSFLLCGVNLLVSAWFTGLNNGIISAIVAFARTLIFEMTSIFVLPLILGIDGIWMAVDVAEVMALILAIYLLLRYRKRYGY